ncbi:hypothetical protein [Chromobacterium aquaticum]|uniref:Uncharacterized protein n=1 Tax=Chromobacterium aquaticum TaxID=467180 RepID=A0ABV8ZX92_9NEIS|nr:hypothetical protein [Chromobacterium aquaticum]MCD5362778.1 hypothetical protein [Chromobacterium aquaticum]
MCNALSKLALVCLIAVSTNAVAESEIQMQQSAMRGDYQAQRNLAYSYAIGWATTDSPNYVPKKPVDACAWYRVIASSNNPKVQSGDYSNEWTYCSKLRPDQSESAWIMAKKLMKQIAKK